MVLSLLVTSSSGHGYMLSMGQRLKYCLVIEAPSVVCSLTGDVLGLYPLISGWPGPLFTALWTYFTAD